MRRYWIHKNQITESVVIFEGDSFHHIFVVCRQNVGSNFEIITESQECFLVQVTSVTKKKAQAQIKEQRLLRRLPSPKIHLALSIPKFSTLEDLLPKIVELGVSDIHPFFSDFSFIKTLKSWPTAEDDKSSKKHRWEKIIEQACEQSGRFEKLQIHAPVDLQDLASAWKPSDFCLFAYESKTEYSVKEFLKKISLTDFQDLWVIIGSEGGFSIKEVEFFKSKGYPSVGLGDQVLKVETACITLISILKYEAGLMESR